MHYPDGTTEYKDGRKYDARLEQKMDELARKYVETYDPEIPYEIYRLARQLEELDH